MFFNNLDLDQFSEYRTGLRRPTNTEPYQKHCSIGTEMFIIYLLFFLILIIIIVIFIIFILVILVIFIIIVFNFLLLLLISSLPQWVIVWFGWLRERKICL